MQRTDDLNHLFLTPCSQLVDQQKVIVIDSTKSVTEGCELLVSNKITSAPVYNHQLKCFVGMFDYRDIVDFVLLVFHQKQLSPISEDQVVGISDIVRQAISGEPVSISQCSDLSRKNPFYSVHAQSSLMAAAQVLSQGNGIHRINVTGDDEQVQAVLSQSAIIKFLLENIHCFSALASRTVEQLGLCQSPAVTIHESSPVIDALKKMSEFGLSSVAVVNSDERLIGNISMTDIKYIFKHSRYSRLWTTCSHFIGIVLNQQGLENDGKDRFPTFEAHLDTPLKNVMQKIVATRVHRIWVTNSHSQVIGVVTLTDIIKLCLNAAITEQ